MPETNEAVERQLQQGREAVEQSQKEYAERTKGKPTPTQEENDRAKLGEHVLDKEDDGSGPDPYNEANERARRATVEGRQMEPKRQTRPGYETRAATPQHPPQPHSRGSASS